MTTRRILTVALMAFALAMPAFAQFSMTAAPTLPAATEPDTAATGDFNGDGFTDIAVTVDQPDRVLVFFGTGTGSFGAPQPVFLGGGVGAAFIVARDFDGDTDVDLAVSLHNVNQVRVLLNTNGTFAPGSTASTGSDPTHMASEDMDGDGDFDLVTSNRDGNSVTVILNAGGNLTTLATVAVGNDPRAVALGDWDGDGDFDAAVSNHDDRTIGLLTNTGGGNLVAGGLLSVGGQVRPEGVAAADFDGDGDTDIGTSTSGNGFNFFTTFTNNGGTFVGPNNFAAGGQDPDGIAVADIDGDGDLDVALANQGSNNATLLANSGTGAFGAPQAFAAGLNPEHVVLGDLTGGGAPDLVIVNKDSHDVSIYVNQSAPPAGPGLTLVTPPAIGTTMTVRLSSPGDANRGYLCGFALGTTPGITLLGGQTVPLNNDALLAATTSFGNPFVANPFGALNTAAQADVFVNVPNLPTIVGGTIFGAFVVADAASISGIGTISPALPITFQ